MSVLHKLNTYDGLPEASLVPNSGKVNFSLIAAVVVFLASLSRVPCIVSSSLSSLEECLLLRKLHRDLCVRRSLSREIPGRDDLQLRVKVIPTK